MSRRFGRNQRRRMREALEREQNQVANLQEAIAQDRGLLAYQGARLREFEDFTRAVAQMVGQQAIIANVVPAGMAVRLRSADVGNRFEIAPSPRMSSPRGPWDATATMDELRIQTLHLLKVKVVQHEMEQRLDARIQFADGMVGYGMSEAAIDGMTAEAIAERVTPEIARMLATEIKRGRPCRRG